jgi:prepilin-type N-terminal cleavage/methylation domain-containing protein
MSHNSKQAFTLIELSIVLVIIGLISAGVLVGRDLIRAAEVRSQVSQLEQMDTAVTTFRLKYSCLPGDCLNAESFGLGVAGGDGRNGDGDGAIDYLTNNPLDEREAEHFWHHLGQANLINGSFVSGNVPGVNTLPLAMDGKGVYGNSVGGFWFSSTVGFLYPNVPSVRNAWLLLTAIESARPIGVYDPMSSYAVDIKIDDGRPITGKMMVAAGDGNAFVASNAVNMSVFSTNNIDASQVFPDACVDDSDVNNITYNLRNERANSPSPQSLCIPVVRSVLQ